MTTELRTTTILESMLDALATESMHDGFAQFAGSAGAAESLMEELGRITDQLIRLESRTGLGILQDVITDLLGDNLDEHPGLAPVQE